MYAAGLLYDDYYLVSSVLPVAGVVECFSLFSSVEFGVEIAEVSG